MIQVEKEEPVIVQGITGRYGSLHTKLMLEYGTRIVAGVTPGKAGQRVENVPVYNSMKDALSENQARASIIFVPAQNFLSAALEAVDAGIKLVVAITEHVPIIDTLRLLNEARKKDVTVIGPNTPGLIIPSIRFKLGIMPSSSFSEGKVALFSRSGTLMYEVAYYLTRDGLGQSIALGIGGDPINCTTFEECLDYARNDESTEAVVLVGEIGGSAEENVSRYVRETNFRKPIIAYIAGRHAPREKKMGHAGAIIQGNQGTAESKINSLIECGALVAQRPSQIPELVRKAMF